MEKKKSILKSNTFWFQLITVVGLLFTQYGNLGLININIAAFIAFSVNIVIQKFFSNGPGNIKDNTTFTFINACGAILMISDYFLNNQIFNLLGAKSFAIGIIVATVNTLIRTYVLASEYEQKNTSN